jgi:hypothetical protein
VQDAGEECDGDQACSVECLKVVCNNGRLDEGEDCEPPAAGSCSDRCQLISCGNGRVDGGEECEPPGVGACSTSCLLIECGNSRLEPPEDCDPPAPGSCDGSCRSIECGNGVVEEGEGCDPPAAGVCDASCRTEGCGDGRTSGSEECDPPAAGSCDGACRVIRCGNERVDEGEECEPPATASCNASCRTIRCGDGRVDAGEGCDPPAARRCNDACRPIVCGDGRLDPGEECEPVGANDPACSQACARVDSTGVESLYGFDTSVQGWRLYATSPERLKNGSAVTFDSQNGDKTPGVLKLSAPFDASNQKIEVQVTLAATDMRGRTIRARVRLGSGLSTDTLSPGGIKLFAKAGSSYGYASGPWTYLPPGSGWVDVTLDCDAPVLVPTEFDSSSVREIGVELRTFSETTGVSAAVVYLDSIGY